LVGFLGRSLHSSDDCRHLHLAAQIESRKFDEAEASLEAQQGEDILNADSDGFVSPNVAEGTQLMQDAAAPPDEEMPKRRLRTRFVKRFGGKMVRARKVRVKAGEPVFVKIGDTFRLAGVVNEKNRLPIIYVEEEATK
jgi:hypothetical protein